MTPTDRQQTAMSPADQRYQRDLGDGLRVRWSTEDDTERIARMSSQVFRGKPDDPPNEYCIHWVRDMMSGRHPLMSPLDYALVEDTNSGAVVAATCVMNQVWEYGGIAFGVGRPELVATLPEYRNRGLIRALFELFHARSEARGHLVQGITGISHFYRQFGYEYALELDTGRSIAMAAIPPLAAGATEPYRLRPGTVADIPPLRELYALEQTGAPVVTRPGEDYWRWVLEGMNPASGEGWDTQMIVDAAGRAVGYAQLPRVRSQAWVRVWGLGMLPEVSLVAALPSVLRGVCALAPEIPLRRADVPAASQLWLMLGSRHPMYEALGAIPSHAIERPYAWYVRVPDLPRLLRHIAPELERRLVGSVAANYSGEIRLDFFRGGLRLVFEAGRLTEAEDWRRGMWETASGEFPPGIFWQLVFGHRSVDELVATYPDVSISDDLAPVMRALFPARPSLVRPLD